MLKTNFSLRNGDVSITGTGKNGERLAFIIIMSIVAGCGIIYLVKSKNSKNSEKQKSEPEKTSDNTLALGMAPFLGHSPSLTDTIV